MKLIETIDANALADSRVVAESNAFAIYDLGRDTFAIVQRHEAVRWQALTISGDGVFRVLEMLAEAARTLYRDVANDLSERRPR